MFEVSGTSNPFGSADISVGNNPSEVPNAIITTVKFDGMNYLAWSQSTLLYVSGIDKEEYTLSI